jgi:hypothetical protein
MTGLDLPKAEASSKEVLATKANTEADATSGPDEQVSATTYVTWTRPDGTSTVAPLSNSATYEAKGFKKGAEIEMDSIVAWNQENAAKAPAAAPKAEVKK